MYHSEETRWDVGVESPLVVTKLAWAGRPSRLRFQITRVGHGIAWGTARPTLVARVMTTYDHVGLSSEAEGHSRDHGGGRLGARRCDADGDAVSGVRSGREK